MSVKLKFFLKKKKAYNELIQTDTFWVWCILFLCQSSRINHWGTLLHGVTRSFIDMNAHTVVYFVSITDTPLCSWSSPRNTQFAPVWEAFGLKMAAKNKKKRESHTEHEDAVFQNYICSWTRGRTDRRRKASWKILFPLKVSQGN